MSTTQKTRNRANAPVNVWHRSERPLETSRWEFRISALRTGLPTLYIDDLVETFDWTEDDQHVMSGSITVNTGLRSLLALHVGDEIVTEYSLWGQNQWRSGWKMRLVQPEYQVGGRQFVYQLEDDLVRLNQSKDDFKYRKNRAHPHGWTGHDVVVDVCRRFGVQVAVLPRMTHLVTHLVMIGASPLQVIVRVLRQERVYSGNRYFVRWVDGRLAILPFRRGRDLLLLSDVLIDATLTETLPDTFATVLEIASTKDEGVTKDSKGHKHHKKKHLTIEVSSANGIKLYGYVKRRVSAPQHDSLSQLQAWGQRTLRRVGRPKRDLSVTIPGVPTIRRGDALRISLPEVGLVQQIVFVSRVTHAVQPGAYTTQITVTFDDPFIDTVAKSTQKKKADTARKRGRTAPDGSSSDQATATPKRNANRTNK